MRSLLRNLPLSGPPLRAPGALGVWSRALVFGACLAACASPAAAQLCYRGRPAPVCRVSVVTEATVTANGTGRSRRSGRADNMVATFDAGAYVNVGRRTAVGASGFGLAWSDWNSAGTGTSGLGYGVRLRLRRWLTRTVSLDVGPGLVLETRLDSDSAAGRPLRWATVQLGLGVEDVAALVVQVDRRRMPLSGGGHQAATSVTAGLRLGYIPGAVLGALGIGLYYALKNVSLLDGFTMDF